MASPVADQVQLTEPDPGPAPGSEDTPRSRHRLRTTLIVIAAVLAVIVVAGVVWFVFGREQAEQLSDDQALVDFRANGGDTTAAQGRPVAGVYPARASGTESIGLPGFDEQLGPNAPMTLTYGDAGCFTSRIDFNSHHWRSWTYCPSPTATFALTGLESWTERKAPGLDLATLSTYTCDVPLDVVWTGATAGDTRTGSCPGTSDLDDAVTADAASLEVLGLETLEIDGTSVDVVHVRTNDEFSEAQTGAERGEWWLDAETALPVKFRLDASLSGASGDYAEDIAFELTSLRPAT